MSTASRPLTGGFWREAGSAARHRLAHLDRAGWRHFLIALVGLALSFLMAVLATTFREVGNYRLGATLAALALAVAGLVAVKTVPFLVRRTALERWIRGIEYELTREGLAYLGIVVVILVAALNTGNNLLFIIVASLLAGLVVSAVVAKVVLSGLDLDFDLPERVFAGAPATARLALRHVKLLFPSFSVTVSAAAGGKARRAGPPADARAVRFSPLYFPYLRSRACELRRLELNFPRRGRYTHEGFRVSTKFPFGLLRKTREVSVRREIIALPRVEPTEEFYEILPLLSGELESYAKGRGHDLYAIRDYQESDSARHVDWKATAKAYELKVREFTREDERRLTLAFDPRLASNDKASLERFEKAVQFCACLAWHFYEIDSQMRFVTAGFRSDFERGAESVYAALERLAVIEPETGAGEDVLARLLPDDHGFHIILTNQPRGSIPTDLWSSSFLVFYDSL